MGPDYQPPQGVSPQRWGDWHSEAGSPAQYPDTRAKDCATKPSGRCSAIRSWTTSRPGRCRPTRNCMALSCASRARMQRRIVSSAYLPEVTLEGGVSRQKQSLYGTEQPLAGGYRAGQPGAREKTLGDPFTLYQAGFDTSWEPDLWGAGRSVPAET
ncbi:hypothetical protein ACPA9J_27205 [Pseudomonas aeruginosa]